VLYKFKFFFFFLVGGMICVWFVRVLPAASKILKFFLSLPLQPIGWCRLLLGANIREDYTQFFRLLLYIEEHQMENDIHMYDRYDQTLKPVKDNLLSLEVS
jgi:hypothetical protein